MRGEIVLLVVLSLFLSARGQISYSSATLSVARAGGGFSVAGTKLVYGGGTTAAATNATDSLDTSTGVQLSSTAGTLSALTNPRSYVSSGSNGTVAFFAGGQGDVNSKFVVDVFDSTTSSWWAHNLPVGRVYIGVATVGGATLFVGT